MDKFRYTVLLENLINYYNGQTLEPKFLLYFLICDPYDCPDLVTKKLPKHVKILHQKKRDAA